MNPVICSSIQTVKKEQYFEWCIFRHAYMPDSHKFVHYHWIRVYINQARAEIACVGIRYSLFQKQKENHLHQQWGKKQYNID